MIEGLEMICFKIISNVGGARSSYIEAIRKQSRATLRAPGMYKDWTGDVLSWT